MPTRIPPAGVEYLYTKKLPPPLPSSSMIANLPARKPVPGDTTATAPYGTAPHYAHHHAPPPPPQQQQPLYPPAAASHDRSHSRTRTNSSTVMPYTVAPPPPSATHTYTMTHQTAPMMPPQPVPAQYIAASGGTSNGRRTMSTATTSTTSTGNGPAGHRTSTLSGYSTASSDNIQRSASSRSGGSGASSLSPSSYVALMRKQKATVWCDRAQHEDPRILAAQRQAKLRATAEVAGGGQYKSSAYGAAGAAGGAGAHAAGVRASTGSSSMVGGVRSKIRHHGAPKASAYMGSAHLGSAGVPMRLSASEVDENDSDSESHMAAQQQQQQQQQHQHHSRTGSGRSSLGSAGAGSGRKVSQYGAYQSYQPQHQAYTNNVTPPGAESPIIGHNPTHYLGTTGPRGGAADDHDADEDNLEDQTPVPGGHGREADDYFSRGLHGKGSGGSGSSGEREEKFGSVGGLARPRGALAPEQQVARQQASADELRRRGSVDDRTMTMSGVRLFVANPDLSD